MWTYVEGRGQLLWSGFTPSTCNISPRDPTQVSSLEKQALLPLPISVLSLVVLVGIFRQRVALADLELPLGVPLVYH